MATATTITLEPGALHRLMAWLSPAYPVGGFSYSHGLEAAVEEGSVRDRAGLVGADGATHAGSFDVTYLATLPNFVVMAAADEVELAHMVHTMALHDSGPIAVRYPRGSGCGAAVPRFWRRCHASISCSTVAAVSSMERRVTSITGQPILVQRRRADRISAFTDSGSM